MLNMKGTVTALITPFVNDQLDEEGLAENVRFQLDHGVDGLLVLGSTGEASTLHPKEKERVISIVVGEAKGKVPVFAGTGTNCTRTTIENTQRAVDLGVDGVSILAPYYNKPTQKGIFLHFEEVASKINIPILIYNIPCRTGVNIDIATLLRIVDFPQIIGIKECSGNLTQICEIMDKIALKRNNFAVFSGDDITTISLMALGASGVVSVVSNLVPGPIVELVNAALQGDYVRARHFHYELLPLFKGAFIETNPAPIKEAMNLCGLPAGKCRLPLAPLQSENQHLLGQILNKMHLTQTSFKTLSCTKSLSEF